MFFGRCSSASMFGLAKDLGSKCCCLSISAGSFFFPGDFEGEFLPAAGLRSPLVLRRFRPFPSFSLSDSALPGWSAYSSRLAIFWYFGYGSKST